MALGAFKALRLQTDAGKTQETAAQTKLNLIFAFPAEGAEATANYWRQTWVSLPIKGDN